MSLIEWLKTDGVWAFACIELVVIFFLSWKLWKERTGYDKICKLINDLIKKVGGNWHLINKGVLEIKTSVKDLHEDINEMEKKNIEFATELKQVIKMVDTVTTKVIEIVSSWRTFMDNLK